MKTRPKYIIKQLSELNDYFRRSKTQDYINNPLFVWWCHYLIRNDWYRGFNFHIDRYIGEDRRLVRALTGPTDKLIGEDRNNWYLQIW